MKNDQVLFYVDDDGDDLKFFGEAASELDFEVKLFNSGEKLMSALKNPKANPSVVFVDLNMPGKSGYEVIAEMRESKRWKDLPAVVLTTASDSYSVEKSRVAGASLFIQKPTTLDGLIVAIDNVVSRDWSEPADLDFMYKYRMDNILV